MAHKEIRAILIAITIRSALSNGMAQMITSGLFLGKHQKKPGYKKSADKVIDSLDRIKQSVSDFAFIVPDLTTYLKEKCAHFRAGNIANFSSAWQALTSDKEILTTVKGATIEFDAPPYP